MNNNPQRAIFLPGLNGIRAMAAISVIVSHIGLNLKLYRLPNFGGYSLASFGVTMFFALSGFLITYLLIKEKEKTNDINVKKFYFRRFLRIWPLYYLYLVIVLLFIGTAISYKALWMYILFLANVPFVFNMTLPYLAHYWSVAVEEQFYLFWPWVIKKSKNILRGVIIFATLFFVTKILLSLFNAPQFLLSLFHYTRFGCLAMGGIAAYLLVTQNQMFLKVCQSKFSEVIAWIIFGLIAFDKFHIFSIIDHEIVTFATLVIIINQVNNPQKIISLENKVFDYLGKISYGLYIYNPLVIFLISFILKKFMSNHIIINYVMVYSTTILVVILISHISYYYFEALFLKFKNKFSIIKSKSSAS